MDLATAPDEQLWHLASKGDREAFSKIVERYQSLICSLAYSACGALGTSEDMAQETFITAWHHLKDLREPGKLRHWLCGIVRNIASNAVRRELRRMGPPESLAIASQEPASEDDPAAQAVTREEEMLLWRTLSELPENYREPLVLFYREERSVAEVARQLDLTEDTVKQRLSRGRTMLREEMVALVESTLSRPRRTAAFTAGVLAALPLLPVSKASAGVVGSKAVAAAGKGALASVGLGAILGPMIGLFVGIFSAKAAALTARTERERVLVVRHARWTSLFCWAMSIGLVLSLSQAGRFFPVATGWIVAGILAWVTVLVLTIMWTSSRMQRERKRIRVETGTEDAEESTLLAGHTLKLTQARHYESRLQFLGLPLFAFATGGADPGSYGSWTARGWFAVGDRALSPFVAVGGIAIGPIAIGAVTVGVLGLSPWGFAIGVLAAGSAAVGWWSFGVAALGWKSAVGAAALARDYAMGIWVRAAEANTPAAKEWFHAHGCFDGIIYYFSYIHWIIAVAAIVTLVVKARSTWQLRQVARQS